MKDRSPKTGSIEDEDEGEHVPVSSRRALVLHPYLKRRPGAAIGGEGAERAPEQRLEEAVGLAIAIDLEIAAAESVPLSSLKPGSLIGEGQIERFAALIAEKGIGVAIIDGAVSPVQQRNLERALKCKVIDRTGLILEIFGARARTREGRMQVELAHLNYQRSRLVRSWTHLERQRGGFGFLGGPGESQLEIDRRLIGERIAKIKRDLESVVRTRSLHRKSRAKVPYPVVALVGYTNAGKSTLFNRLASADVLAKDQLFATLDPTMRGLRLPDGHRIILSDTVGFISDLPHQLVAAFRATLEEVLEADIIVHVRDCAHPDTEAQAADVMTVLKELGVSAEGERPIMVALNKIDLLPADERDEIVARTKREPLRVAVSALDGSGCTAMLEAIGTLLSKNRNEVEISVSSGDGAGIAWLYRHGEVRRRTDKGDLAKLIVAIDPSELGRFAKISPDAKVKKPKARAK